VVVAIRTAAPESLNKDFESAETLPPAVLIFIRDAQVTSMGDAGEECRAEKLLNQSCAM